MINSYLINAKNNRKRTICMKALKDFCLFILIGVGWFFATLLMFKEFQNILITAGVQSLFLMLTYLLFKKEG